MRGARRRGWRAPHLSCYNLRFPPDRWDGTKEKEVQEPVVHLIGDGKDSSMDLLVRAWQVRLPPVQKLALLYVANAMKADYEGVAEFIGVPPEDAAHVLHTLQIEGYLRIGP